MKWLALAGAAVAGAIVSTAPARADGDLEAGRKMAVEHCARCQVIGDFNPFGGIGPNFPRTLARPAADHFRHDDHFRLGV